MKCLIYIVGLGPGSSDYILPKALKTLENADLVMGFSRALESIDFIDNNKIAIKTLSDILDNVEKNKDKDIAVIASGDPCFYGVTEYIKRNLNKDKVEIIPGISSFQYLMCKLGKSWQGAFLGSVHGREADFLSIVSKNKTCVFLTDKTNSPKILAEKLLGGNINCKVYVGENLSYEDEKITIGNPLEISKGEFTSLSVFIVEEA